MTNPMSESDIRALADQAEIDALGVVGVPEPFESPEAPELRPYTMARDTISQALDLNRQLLAEKRALREELRLEIALLVDETELLDRMWRLANKGAKDG